MRARVPDRSGTVDSNGVPVYWELFGEGDRTVVFAPGWQIGHSRYWKMQLPYFARYCRVVTFDPPGCGKSGRPATGYDEDTLAAHMLAVLDATDTPRASLVCHSRAGWWGALIAARHPERVERLVFVGSAFTDPLAPRDAFHQRIADPQGWEKFNKAYWHAHYADFVRFFIEHIFTEPHTTKAIDDGIAWGLENTPAVLAATAEETGCRTSRAELLAALTAPVLIIHGTEDAIRPITLAETVHAAVPGSVLVPFDGSGHAPHAREPVRFNLAVRDFLGLAPAPRRFHRATRRPRRALFISSPIGLGHALRDVAIARELRALHPDLQIDWLAQDPVTRVLDARGERVHPASRELAGESAHIESEAGEHDLHVFQAWRNMDEILLANFMVLHDVLEAAPYDLVIGDEAWETDYYLHENPELKSTAFAWLTDFVGWIPMDEGREAFLTADYNAEMIEQIARFPRVRDRALFVGNPDDVVDVPFGPNLPKIRDWTAEHFEFPGYILPFDPAEFADRAAVRTRLGFRPDEQVVFAAVGGSGVGAHLLRKVIAAVDETRRLVPGLRMIVVAGPRIDPASLPQRPGLEIRPFVPDLYAHLAACDLAVVQGGLTTCMELTATKRPFLYFPLRNHFEQNVHVPHRLARYGAGTRMDYDRTTPEALAHAIAGGLKQPVLYRDVETGGARRAAASLASLL
ncbi:MAG: alpha/beta fold hydrolase [Candidatus Rokubacteria bacterium]|nr:alpha/beta fold hydrolase [Candidatus Rokubacteria bacterium]